MTLKQCPFCGSEAASTVGSDNCFYIQCVNDSCDIQPGVDRSNHQRAIDSWNRRTASPEAASTMPPEANELAALMRDAKRYRWLRRPQELEGLENVWWDDYDIVRLSYDDYEHLTGEKLDAAIDRGIAESSKPQVERP